MRDLQVAVRLLLKSPAYTSGVVLVLGLVIGANTAIFSTVYGVLLKPLPIRDPEHLVVAWDSDPSRSLPVVELSYRTFERWATVSRSFQSSAALGSSVWHAVLKGRGAPVRLASSGVSASFFETLGAAPLAGRLLLPEDDEPHAAAVAVLSYSAWVQYFGADPNVVGTLAELDRTRTIVGVMPQEFDFPRGTHYWFPVVPLLASISRADFNAFDAVGVLFVIGRLQPAVSPRTAVEELNTLAGHAAQYRFGTQAVVTPFLDYYLGPVREGLWALWASVGLLLLIACANVSALLLTRAAHRARDHAVRAALGAPRLAIARMWLLEALLLAVTGGLLGLGVAWWMTKAIVAVAPSDLPRLGSVDINPVVALFTVAVVLITAAAAGVGAARRASFTQLTETLNESAYGTSGPGHHRARFALLVLQIAFSVVLLISAGLVVRSFVALRQLDIGFVPADVLTMFVGSDSNDRTHQLLSRIESMPQVQAAGAIYLRPLELGPIGQETRAQLEGETETDAQDNPTLNYQSASPGYFTAMRIRLVQGRFFSEEDRAGSALVAVVSETAARRMWPGESAIGKRLLLHGQEEWRTVVGVVGDVHYRGLGDVRLDVYEPALQSSRTPNYFVVRTGGDPLAMVGAIQDEVRRSDSSIVIDGVSTMEAILSRAVAPWRFTSWLLAVLAAAAFLLASVGLFSLVALEVSSRRYELAIRRAVGASNRHLLRSVFTPVMSHAFLGVAAGLLAALGLTRTLRGLLFQIEPLDPATWLGVTATVSLVVAIAAFLPARRATTVNPLILLRR